MSASTVVLAATVAATLSIFPASGAHAASADADVKTQTWAEEEIQDRDRAFQIEIEEQLAKQQAYLKKLDLERMRCRLAPAFDALPRIHYVQVATRSYRDQAAIDAGGVVEWDYMWYCAHNYDAGGAFYDFREHDIVHVADQTVMIDGTWHGNRFSNTVSDVRSALGYDNVLFQTCAPEGGGSLVIYYGHAIEDDSVYSLIAA